MTSQWGLHQSQSETRVSPWDESHQFGGNGATRARHFGVLKGNHVVTFFFFFSGSILQGSARMISDTDKAPSKVLDTSYTSF